MDGGGQFNADIVRDHVIISVMVFDSLRGEKSKAEDKKLYRENGNLASFKDDVARGGIDDNTDESSVMATIASLNPVVIVDESHNAKSDLSREMLARLNPSCIIELTATPRDSSNIISFVNAMKLREANMVKLPVVVRNLSDQAAVISHAIDLRARLEAEAKAEVDDGGAYIRPIVLFQASSKNAKNDDGLTFEKLRDDLVKQYGINPDWIKIKTANVDELKGIDLMANDCQVRFIITINALKEGWDCPFAYILATLADRSSAVDVEQILGRILRQPYIRSHSRTPLNMSYVLTASAVFSQTLEKIVAGLNQAGFSRNDYRTPDLVVGESNDNTRSITTATNAQNGVEKSPVDLFSQATSSQAVDSTAYSASGAFNPSENQFTENSVDATLRCGEEATNQLDNVAATRNEEVLAPEEREMMNNYPLRVDFQEDIAALRLPQFYRRTAKDSLFADAEGGVLLDREMLLEGFRLSDCDLNDFNPSLEGGEVAQIDLKALNADGLADYEPTRIKLNPRELSRLRDYFASLSTESKRQQLSGLISNWLGKMPPLGEADLRSYIDKILVRMSPAELDLILEQQNAFVEVVKKRAKLEMAQHRKKTLSKWVGTDDVFTAEKYQLALEVHPIELYTPTENTLYEREESARSTNLEVKMADWLASADNIHWWHRNHQTRGFNLNGSINHYPDFIIKTKKGSVVLVETKGEHLKNDDSETKVELGKLWERCAGRTYSYIMVFEQTPISGSVNWQDAVEILKKI